MAKCIVCGKPGERHHIIHKCEGGLDAPVNYIYLCDEHHRGPMGPHQNQEIDLKYKLIMQESLEDLFPKKYYSAMDIRSISQISNASMKKFMKTNLRHKEGYERNDIIYFLMGGNIYREDYAEFYYLAEQY